jgi:LEA14-like dessication related protein
MSDSHHAIAGRWMAIVLALVLAGCAAIVPHVVAPHVAVTGVAVEEINRNEQRFRVRLHVINPNAQTLGVRAIHYRLELAGEEFGNGEATARFVVPGHGETDFEVLLTTRLAITIFHLLPLLKDTARPLEYHLTGTVTAELPFATTIPFDERGHFSVGH